jgi:hypothetical protein
MALKYKVVEQEIPMTEGELNVQLKKGYELISVVSDVHYEPSQNKNFYHYLVYRGGIKPGRAVNRTG